MTQRLVIAAGGTGGHLFPAMRLAHSLRQQLPALELLFVGSGLANSPYFSRDRFAYADIKCAPWCGLKPHALWQLCSHNTRGIWQATQLLRRFKPTAIVGFGSYHTLPAMAAAWIQRLPLFLYEPNTIPGKVNKLFSSYAHTTAIQFTPAQAALRGPVRHVAVGGHPLTQTTPASRIAALRHYGLDCNLPTLLIAGGSQGAIAVNEAVAAALCPAPLPLQVIHLLGRQCATEKYAAIYRANDVRAVVLPFEAQMEHAWAAADLFIGRAGASTLAELLQSHTPALLIPYPWASEGHQEHNAHFFTHVVGGGQCIPQTAATAKQLHCAIRAAFSNSAAQLEQWRHAIGSYQQHITLPSLAEATLDFLIHLQSPR